jgi:hypothetical protein
MGVRGAVRDSGTKVIYDCAVRLFMSNFVLWTSV